MGEYTIAADEIGSYAKQLTAETIDTVTVERDVDHVEVWSDGTAALYLTVDGTDPVVAGNATYEIPAGPPAVRNDIQVPTPGNTVIKLISAGTPHYSVTTTGAK